MSGARGAEASEMFYRVVGCLYRHTDRLSVIEYPKNMSRRSVDIVADLLRGGKVLVKVAPDVGSLPRGEIDELRRISSAMDMPALLVSERREGVDLIDGVVYERRGVKAVNLETLEKLLSGDEEVYIYQDRDTFRVSIDFAKMKEKRLEMGLSLGDVAQRIGTTRKTVYEYERGVIEPGLERIEKLLEIFGEEILKPIDIMELGLAREMGGEERFDVSWEEEVARSLMEAGFKVVHARKTAMDIGGGGREERVLVVVDHGRENAERLLDRALYADKMAKVLDSKVYLVVVDRSVAREVEREGREALSPREFREQLAGESGQ